MSEMENSQQRRDQLRYRLLATASAAALLAGVVLTQQADAQENDRPTIWIELGGALDQMDAGDTRWSPPNLTPPISNPPPSPFGKLPAIGYDEDLKISFTPDESDWSFSASVRYGRAAHGPRHNHDQSYKFNIQTQSGVPIKYNPTNLDFANAIQKSRSTHAILDFQAGKDLGLGMFGGKSVFSAGIRVVKLNESADGHLTAFVSAPAKYPPPHDLVHKADFVVSHSFNGIGPSVSWDGASPLAGTLSEGFSFDWGVNAAILFGRQKTGVALHTKDTRYYPANGYPGYTSVPPKILSESTQAPARARTVIVPNVGGVAGVSWRLPNVKVSLGYRADFFFGAIDGGLTTSQKETRGFYGPFANVSIGVGG